MSLRAGLWRIRPALSWGLPAAFALFAMLASLIAGYLELTVQERQVEQVALRSLFRQMPLLQGRIEYLLMTANPTQVQHALADLGGDPDLSVALLTDHQGVVVASIRRRWIGLPVSEVVPGLPGIAPFFERVRLQRRPEIAPTSEVGSIAVAYPVTLAVEPGALRPSRVGILYVKRNLTGDLLAARRWTWLRTGIVTALLVIGALGFAMLGRGLITGRALRIVRAAERYALGNREARAGLRGRDEIGRIGRAFDTMADRLSEAQRLIEANEARMRAIFDVEPECVKLLTLEGVLIVMNAAGLRMIEADSADAVVGQPIFPLVADSHREAFCEFLSAAGRGETRRLTFEIVGLKGTRRWMDSHATRFQDPLTGGDAVLAVTRDVTEQKATEARLFESEERFRTMVDSVHVMFWVAGTDGGCTHFNRAWLDFTGRTLAEELGYGWLEDVHPDDRVACIGGYTKAFEAREPFILEYRFKRRDGLYRLLIDTGGPRYFPDGSFAGYIGGAIDVTEHREAEQRARYLAFHDPLTGLPNRGLALDRLKGILAQAEREHREAAVLFVDLDRFKDINDSLGHSVGDRILQEVSARLRPALREGDTVARLGGDEFLILLPRIEAAEDGGWVAQKLIETIRSPYLLEAHELHVGASVGVSLYPRDGRDSETLIKHADAALYHAKNKGRNQYQFFDPDMDARAHERLALSSQLRQALEHAEIEVHYQPQIDAVSGEVVGLEALARWRHPERGAVSPAVFVPIAEDTGLIVALGRYVLRHACATAASIRKAGLGAPRMSVNLSAHQLRHAGLVEEIAEVLAASGLMPCDIELELTESSVMEDIALATDRIGGLVDLGVRLALDDFGTGYSSLAYLKRFRIHVLKIDQSFVRDLPGDPEDAAIVRAITAIGRALDLDLIAEGVETLAQAEFLLAEGCRHIQGYLYCPPLPLEALIEWLRERERKAVGEFEP